MLFQCGNRPAPLRPAVMEACLFTATLSGAVLLLCVRMVLLRHNPKVLLSFPSMQNRLARCNITLHAWIL